jgi:hypothetical protein
VGGAELSQYGKEIPLTNFTSTHADGVTKMKNLDGSYTDLVSVTNISPTDFKHIPMSSNQTGVITVDTTDPLNPINVLEVNKCEVYSGLYEAISLALFKKTGKTAGLLNEGTGELKVSGPLDAAGNPTLDAAGNPILVDGSGILFQIRKQLGDAWAKASTDTTTSDHGVVETNATKQTSRFFNRYVDSGRYAHDAGNGPNTINKPINYNFNDMKINMIVELTGVVQDIDGALDANNNAVPAPMTDVQINSVFGTNGGDWASNATATNNAAADNFLFSSNEATVSPAFVEGGERSAGLKHLVARGGATYKVRCLVQLIQNDLL